MPTRSQTKTPSLFSLLALAALGCAATDSLAAPKPEARAQVVAAQIQEPPPPSAALLRTLGPKGLAIALERYDALPEGREKDQQALVVDEVAAQRYASVSRLFWYTDLAEARSSSLDSGKPILSLRMLGRLDEDYSCANSRLFRTVLYANQEVSSYLRDNFTMHWSSERQVPMVTIDFGDGRSLKTTVAGNSAHYVLDHMGRPIDVLPGLYGPQSFLKALAPARKLAVKIRKSKDARAQVVAYHRERAAQNDKRFGKLSSQQQKALGPYRGLQLSMEIMQAEMLTVSKAMVEVPVLRTAGLGLTGTEAPDPFAVQASVTKVEALDDASKALIRSMGPTNWGSDPKALEGRALQNLLAELERRVAGDTLINEYGLRPMISRLFTRGLGEDFAALNKVIYSEVFITPKDDAWLGLGQPETFTGLPFDGLALGI